MMKPVKRKLLNLFQTSPTPAIAFEDNRGLAALMNRKIKHLKSKVIKSKKGDSLDEK